MFYLVLKWIGLAIMQRLAVVFLGCALICFGIISPGRVLKNLTESLVESQKE